MNRSKFLKLKYDTSYSEHEIYLEHFHIKFFKVTKILKYKVI